MRDEAKREELKLWALERMDFRNVHFRGAGHAQPWTLDEFIRQPSQPQQDARETGPTLAEEAQRLSGYQALIKGGKADESMLPVWARMTPEEKLKAERANSGRRDHR